MSRWGSALNRSTLLSGQAGSSKTRTEADTSETGHLSGPRRKSGQTPVRSSTLTPTVASVGCAHFNTGTIWLGPPVAGVACRAERPDAPRGGLSGRRLAPADP